ncbi:MAG: L-threonylcarbamoyladenylate synthase [Candidatus Nanopelagicales bacterium]
MMRIGTSEPEGRERGLGAATAALRRGQLVGLPLDTSYGIAADAFSERGTEALRAAKGRPDLSIPVMVPKVATVAGLAEVDATARRLMLDFWPGPLTLVLHAQSTLAWSLTDPAGRIAVRMPLHPVALELLARTGPLGVVAGASVPTTSAQSMSAPSTAPSTAPTSVLDVDSAFPPELAERLAVILDAGPMPSSAASAVIDLTGARPVLVRPGTLAIDTLRESCPGLVVPGADDPVLAP